MGWWGKIEHPEVLPLVASEINEEFLSGRQALTTLGYPTPARWPSGTPGLTKQQN